MKKIALTFLSLIMATSAFANIHINPDTVVTAIKKHVPADKVNPVIREYNAQLKVSANGSARFGIAANRLWNVCVSAGWNIKESLGKQKCKTFVNALVKSATVTYKEVCGDDKGKTGATERCVTDFKNVKVNIGPAIAIAKEYALVKYKDNSLQCFNKHRGSWNDDYVKCVSQNSNTYYEFQFDSVTESIDNTIKNGIQRAVCNIYNAAATIAGCTGGGTVVAQTTCWEASCAADSTKCVDISKSIAKFGYVAEYKDNTCKISFETVLDRKALRTAFGIDNFVFCAGFQARNNQSTEAHVKEYIASKAGVSVDRVRCDAGFKTYTGSGCKVNGMTDFKDDIKTCYVGGKPIDLVFDDINEDWTTYTDAADQAMGCIVSGGTFSGKRCIGVGEQQCNILRAANIKSCPECTKIYWDATTQSCVLPAGVSAANLQKGVNIGIIIGGTLVGVVVTVMTAGTGGAAVATVVLTGIETVGAGMEITSQLKIDGIADEFLVKSNQCESMSCAEILLKQNLQRMSNIAGDMNDAESKAVDNELARLNELIPATSQFYTDIVGGESVTVANAKSLLDLDSWEPEQVWRAVGIGLQLTSVFTAVGKWVLGKTGMLARKLPNATASITRKAQSSRTALKQQIASGKNVKLSNGGDVKVTVPDYKEPIDLGVIEDVELRAVYQKAYDAEKVITNDMVEIARKSGGDLSGLEYRMKTPESMMGKIVRDREAGEVAMGISDAEVASGFGDIVRYTQTGSKETLTQQVSQTLSELEAKGYKINKVKNRFDTAAGEYKDMMVQLEHSQTGQKLELQFNTHKNLELKEKGHKFYEVTRDMTKSPEEREAAQKAMEEIYKQLEVPNGISGFTY